MTLWVREPGHGAVATPVWPGSQYVFNEGEAYRYETTADDEEVVDSRLLVSPEFGFHRRLTGFISIPSSTPISMTLISNVTPSNRRFSMWAGSIAATIASVEYGESPFSNWPILDSFRLGWIRLPATLAWARFLARVSLLSVDETPRSDVAVGPTETPAAPRDVPASNDVMTAFGDVQAMLGLTTEEIALATGVGLRTLRRWRSRMVRPRRHTARAVWRLYVAARALQRELGAEGVTVWLHTSSPSPIGVLREGDLPAFERLARSRLLAAEQAPRPFSGFAQEPSTENEGEPGRIRRAARRPTSGRLASR